MIRWLKCLLGGHVWQRIPPTLSHPYDYAIVCTRCGHKKWERMWGNPE